MKKMMVMLVALVLMVCISAAALADFYYIKTSGGGYVNVRAGRGTDYEKLGTLPYGDQIDVVNIKNGWAKFNYGSYGYAYVSANFLSKTKPEAVSRSSTSSSAAKVSSSSSGEFDMVNSFSKFEKASYYALVQPALSSSNINLRWGPSTSAPIMGVRRSGYELRVIAQNGSWCQVYDEKTGECGFMSRKYLLETVKTSDGSEG